MKSKDITSKRREGDVQSRGGGRGVGRAELWGVSKQLKIPPGGGFQRGCKMSYIFLGGGGGSG